MSLEQIPLEDLFWKTHLDTSQSSFFLYAKLLIWIPFGIILLWFRIFMTAINLGLLAAISLLFPSFRLPFFVRRLMAASVGFHYTLEGAEKLTKYREKNPVFILTCNHRTSFDILPLNTFTPFALMFDAGFFGGSFLSRWFLKTVRRYIEPVTIEHFAGAAEIARQAQRDRIVSTIKSCNYPVFFYPEGWDTNGSGLLLYQKFMFGLGLPIVPAAMTVTVPFVPIRPGMLGSSILREIFWLYFSPMYHYKVKILDPVVALPGESAVDLAKRVQEVTAAALNIPATNWTKTDALKYRKSLMSGQPAQKTD